jgi:hypothetical protein
VQVFVLQWRWKQFIDDWKNHFIKVKNATKPCDLSTNESVNAPARLEKLISIQAMGEKAHKKAHEQVLLSQQILHRYTQAHTPLCLPVWENF